MTKNSITFDKIKEVLVKFKAVEHRIEYVATKKGVKYYRRRTSYIC